MVTEKLINEMVEQELDLFRIMLTEALKSKFCYGKVEQCRRFTMSKENDVYVRLIIQSVKEVK